MNLKIVILAFLAGLILGTGATVIMRPAGTAACQAAAKAQWDKWTVDPSTVKDPHASHDAGLNLGHTKENP